jgi:hypothetical protein
VLPVTYKIRPSKLGVLVHVQFEELAVEHVEVLVGEVLHHPVDVRLLVHVHAGMEQIRPTHLDECMDA